ncbi:hypothetical protein HPB47_019697 [Ixodes persulcatus]|uniref:Uncharacterized protein n=1 Tax=Ixodes persulcatus TaxID=34615 RepID=A0AC60QHD4_IXOPE|nr:hypothetical protein HPB47_019697 [Ixodes persulcatus]
MEQNGWRIEAIPSHGVFVPRFRTNQLVRATRSLASDEAARYCGTQTDACPVSGVSSLQPRRRLPSRIEEACLTAGEAISFIFLPQPDAAVPRAPPLSVPSSGSEGTDSLEAASFIRGR